MSNEIYKTICLICLAGAGASLGGFASTSAAVVHLTLSLGVGTDILEGSGVLVGQVDAGQLSAVLGGDALHVDVSLALSLALCRLEERLAGFVTRQELYIPGIIDLRFRKSGRACRSPRHSS